MNKFYASCIAVVFAATTFSVSAADMSSQEKPELRVRAEQLQAEKQRNPSWDGGRMSTDARSSSTRDMKPTQAKKTKSKKAKAKKTKAKKGKGNVQKTSSKTKGKSQRAQ